MSSALVVEANSFLGTLRIRIGLIFWTHRFLIVVVVVVVVVVSCGRCRGRSRGLHFPTFGHRLRRNLTCKFHTGS